MSPRTSLPLHTDDISALAKSLRGQLIDCGRVPGHLELLNMLARSTGYRNFQHLRADALSGGPAHKQPLSTTPSMGPDTVPGTRPLAGQAGGAVRPASEPEAPGQANKPTPEEATLRKLSRYFDAMGRLIRWPGRHGHTGPCLWVLWSRIEPRRQYDERGINDLLRAHHLFGDPALLRRELFDRGMLDRTPDCRCYRRIEMKPPQVALDLLTRLADRDSHG